MIGFSSFGFATSGIFHPVTLSSVIQPEPRVPSKVALQDAESGPRLTNEWHVIIVLSYCGANQVQASSGGVQNTFREKVWPG
jgi:hypothetical protein